MKIDKYKDDENLYDSNYVNTMLMWSEVRELPMMAAD